MSNDAVYIISVAAELAGIHPQTLRIYERKGLIEPFRTPGGTRRYSDQDIARLRAIQELTAAGVNLEGVRRIMELEEAVDRLQDHLDIVRSELDQMRRETTHRLRSILPDIVRPGLDNLLDDLLDE